MKNPEQQAEPEREGCDARTLEQRLASGADPYTLRLTGRVSSTLVDRYSLNGLAFAHSVEFNHQRLWARELRNCIFEGPAKFILLSGGSLPVDLAGATFQESVEVEVVGDRRHSKVTLEGARFHERVTFRGLRLDWLDLEGIYFHGEVVFKSCALHNTARLRADQAVEFENLAISGEAALGIECRALTIAGASSDSDAELVLSCHVRESARIKTLENLKQLHVTETTVGELLSVNTERCDSLWVTSVKAKRLLIHDLDTPDAKIEDASGDKLTLIAVSIGLFYHRHGKWNSLSAEVCTFDLLEFKDTRIKSHATFEAGMLRHGNFDTALFPGHLDFIGMRVGNIEHLRSPACFVGVEGIGSNRPQITGGDPSGSTFVGTNMEKWALRDIEWSPNVRGSRSPWRAIRLATRERADELSNSVRIASGYRQIRLNYETASDYRTAGYFSVAEFEERFFQELASRSWWAIWTWLYRFTSGYGHSPLRAGALLVVILVGFGLFYWLAGCVGFYGETECTSLSLPEAMAYSLEAATLRRPTRFIPGNSLTSVLTVVEGLLAVAQAGFLALAIRRSYRRQ